MNKRFTKIISAILILASLLSVFSVAVLAADDTAAVTDEPATDTPVDLSQIDLVFNRNFEEGWDYNNGFSAFSAHKAYIDHEETAIYKYNYFWRVEATEDTAAATSTLEIGALDRKSVV